jgi:CRISPR-associated protein Cas2
MTVVVTRDVPDRFRGFLSSCMLELAPGVYTSPRMTAGVRERVWAVLAEWYHAVPQGSIVMTWVDRTQTGGQEVLTLGVPAKELVDVDNEGLFLVRRPLPSGVTPPAGPPPSASEPVALGEGSTGRVL